MKQVKDISERYISVAANRNRSKCTMPPFTKISKELKAIFADAEIGSTPPHLTELLPAKTLYPPHTEKKV
jgi:hypothetical protein